MVIAFQQAPLSFFDIFRYNLIMEFNINQLIIRKNTHAKNLRLSVNKQGQPVLTVPFLCPKWYALRWAEKQKGWIQKYIFVPNTFAQNQTLSVCGKSYTLRHNPNQRGNTITNSEIIIGGDSAFFNRRVRDLIKKEFLSFLKIQVPLYTQKLDVKFTHISLRDTSSRWGSCSSSGSLSFCWRIAMAPDFVIHYLIAHEVSHLKHMNHGPRFWKTVTALTSDTQRAKSWLKHHAKELQIG